MFVWFLFIKRCYLKKDGEMSQIVGQISELACSFFHLLLQTELKGRPLHGALVTPSTIPCRTTFKPDISGYVGGGFKYFGFFTPSWGRFPFCLIIFRWVETTI